MEREMKREMCPSIVTFLVRDVSHGVDHMDCACCKGFSAQVYGMTLIYTSLLFSQGGDLTQQRGWGEGAAETGINRAKYCGKWQKYREKRKTTERNTEGERERVEIEI